ncbi:hypothetical protein MJT46_000801 [Ovis ammon polii x Ovis aries]|nr:hypothetical protein MJT46_000801 [Ovis ammon polii x Ovis aries]
MSVCSGILFVFDVWFPAPAAGCHAAAASFSGSSPTVLSAAASFEALQCEGPASTQQSMCHPEDDLTDPKEVRFQVKGYTFSEPIHLIVSYELFRAPVLRVTPSAEPQEGKPVTLSCQTKLPLQRSAARLLFSFYKDGRTVRSRGPSPEFQIPTASETHSGSYWCEAATEDNQVWKQSPKLEIRVQGLPVEDFQAEEIQISSDWNLDQSPQVFAATGLQSCFQRIRKIDQEYEATLEKPILSLHPPWTTIFKGEKVTLRCDGYHPLLLELRPISTLWYLGHLLLPSYKKSIEVHTPGVYRCQTRGAPVSDPIHLSVSNDWLILQVPYAAVFEGEPLVMRCRGWYDKIVYKLHYYHDGQPVRYFHSSANYTVPQARASDSGRYQCSGTMRIPVESAPMFSAKVAVTVQELFQAPVLRVMGRVEARGAAFGGVVLRCETRLHPQKRDTPLQFAFYKYSRPVRRYDWDAEYTVPEPEVEELESYWCEAATASRSVRKRSPWLQLPGRGSPLDVASTTAPVLGNQPLSFRKPPVSRSVPSVPSVPNVTSAGPPFPAGGAPTAGPPACAPPTPLHQTAGALKPDVALLLREMQLLQGLLSRVVLELKETQAFPGHTVETSTSHSAIEND